MSTIAARLREELDSLGIVALALLAVATLFLIACIRPLEDRLAHLDRELQQAARRFPPGYVKTANPHSGGSRLATFHAFFESTEGKGVWLARIHGIAKASGLELRAAEYRLADSPGRIERYQITLPLTGTYEQIWTFLESALAEIPILSLDQITLRRKNVGEPRADAELSLSLHLLKR